MFLLPKLPLNSAADVVIIALVVVLELAAVIVALVVMARVKMVVVVVKEFVKAVVQEVLFISYFEVAESITYSNLINNFILRTIFFS